MFVPERKQILGSEPDLAVRAAASVTELSYDCKGEQDVPGQEQHWNKTAAQEREL